MATHLVWFRTDLRVHDNYALHAACRDKNAKVIALFIATPDQWHQHAMAPRQAEFIQLNLNALGHTLGERGIPLHILHHSDWVNGCQEVGISFGMIQCSGIGSKPIKTY